MAGNSQAARADRRSWRGAHVAGGSRAPPPPANLLAQFVLCFRVEVACIMALVQLLSGIADGAVDHPAALNCRPLGNGSCPADDVNIFLSLQELACTVLRTHRQAAIPG